MLLATRDESYLPIILDRGVLPEANDRFFLFILCVLVILSIELIDNSIR